MSSCLIYMQRGTGKVGLCVCVCVPVLSSERISSRETAGTIDPLGIHTWISTHLPVNEPGFPGEILILELKTKKIEDDYGGAGIVVQKVKPLLVTPAPI